jgi:hypothetical protein
VVWIGGREAQDTCCGVDVANVGYGDWFDLMLPWFGCCAILVRDGVADYSGHCSFDGGSSCEIRCSESRTDGVEALCEHDLGTYGIILVLGVVYFYLLVRAMVSSEVSQRDIYTHCHVPIGFIG